MDGGLKNLLNRFGRLSKGAIENRKATGSVSRGVRSFAE
jgi:hypothetical protein